MSEQSKKPFSYFFDQYFQDELGNYPRNTGRVSFLDSLDYKEYEQANNIIDSLEIYHPVDVIIDTSITGNKKLGIYISREGHVTIKERYEEPVKKHIEKNSVRYDASDEEFSIGSESVSLSYEESKKFCKRFAQCVKAFKEQDKPAPPPKITIDTSKSDLDNINARLKELEANLNK